ncbi:Coenzyme F420 hydrogenase/dehydrogenase, beta subunit C-terminal domain [Patescibacteria group bacterium]|nr:Coenzyme F420 hydrogenase/dehydrogenase, beta subunit C-terminal domain [Patescibacteria group bacterium]
MNDTWNKLEANIIKPGLCTQCGTCAGLSRGAIAFSEKKGIPIPTLINNTADIPEEAYSACPAKTCLYPQLNDFVFGKQEYSYLCGIVEKSYIGHTTDEKVRRNAASGGVLSALLIYLLEQKIINGAVCLQVGAKLPHKAEPIIARTKDEILKCAQSVYSVTSTNTILEQLEKEEGPLAYIGLPDQVASIRKLQMMNHPSVRSIKYVFGPYMGTQMYFGAIQHFLKSNGIKSENEIADLKYRAGEWPGYLQIKLKDGRVIKSEKFHYNYLIPFFITSSSLQLVDFTNELADISVGDAWSPKYENIKGGHSVVLARSEQGETLLRQMQEGGLLELKEIPISEAMDMHGHMIDFKKRGAFIRNKWKKIQPDYGYEPVHIPLPRIAVEWCLRFVFAIGKIKFVRVVVRYIPIGIIGPVFNTLRKGWKSVSKPTKRKGLRETQYKLTSHL